MADKKIKVKVVKQSIAEDGKVYKAGEVLEVTAARCQALGKLVTVVENKKEPNADGDPGGK